MILSTEISFHHFYFLRYESCRSTVFPSFPVLERPYFLVRVSNRPRSISFSTCQGERYGWYWCWDTLRSCSSDSSSPYWHAVVIKFALFSKPRSYATLLNKWRFYSILIWSLNILCLSRFWSHPEQQNYFSISEAEGRSISVFRNSSDSSWSPDMLSTELGLFFAPKGLPLLLCDRF